MRRAGHAGVILACLPASRQDAICSPSSRGRRRGLVVRPGPVTGRPRGTGRAGRSGPRVDKLARASPRPRHPRAQRADHASAPMAPTARHSTIGSRRTVAWLVPPSAATGIPAARASRDHRAGPRPVASGWLGVGKAGERKARSAPACRARRSSARVWAELVSQPRRVRAWPGQRPPRRCTPAPSAAARRTSPATTSASRRARQMRARARPSTARRGSLS